MILHQRLFYLLLVLLPTQLGYHFWPEWSLVLGRKVDYLSPTIFLTDILVVTILITWLYSTTSKIKNQKSKIQIKYQKLLIPFIFFVLFVFTNITLATNKSVAIYKWAKVLEFIALGYYVFKTKPNLSLIPYHLSLGVFYSALLAISQFFLQRSIGGPLWWLGERTFNVDTPGIARIALNWDLGFGAWDFGLKLRPYATFPHPNVLGGYLAVLLPVIIQYTNNPIIKLSNAKKIFYYLTMIAGFVALVLTFSRSAIVVGILASTWVIWKKFRADHRRGLFPTAPAVFLAVLLFIAYPLGFARGGHLSLVTFSMTEESIAVRQQLNAAAIRLWRESPIVGIGLGNFLVKLPEALPSRQIYFLQPVHNIYLLLLAETGVVGLVALGLLLFSIFRREAGGWKWEARKRSERLDVQLPISHISLLAFLLLGLVDHYPATLQQGQLLLTVLIALSLF